jgi:hypothetical protein
VRRTAVLALLAALAVPLIIAACVEHPTAPVSEPITVGPSFSFTGGSGTVLGSTNRGELVEIDLLGNRSLAEQPTGSLPDRPDERRS